MPKSAERRKNLPKSSSGTNGTQVRKVRGTARIGRNENKQSRKQKGHLGQKYANRPDRANRKNLSHEALGHLGQMDANRPVRPKQR
ncbi:hypothetical protein KI387_020567, partial [Taxus chinensis]